ncbi:MAG: CoA transferase, partial [Candidatus Bathyarchaeia archaeon]
MSKERVLTKYAKKARGLVSSEEIAKFFEVDDKPEIFNDIVVIDVSYANFAGIYASSILAEFGAEVIKVEPPEGDPARFMTPNGVNLKGVGIPFLIEARNKRFITLDLENNEKDREKFKKLAAKADVIIETYEPGKMDSIGIGYKQLSQINSKLIYVAISTWGQLLPYEGAARIPDSDITAQALSGIASLIGDIKTEPEPFNWPTRAGSWISWYIAGVHAAAGIMLALLYRRKSGKGQMI